MSKRLSSASVVLALFVVVLGARSALAQSSSAAAPPTAEKSKPAEDAGLSLTDDEAQRKAMAAQQKVDQAQPKPDGVKRAGDDDAEASRAVFFSADLAFTRSDLGLLVDDLSFNRTGANGTMYGVSGGYRTNKVSFGLRWRVYDTTEFDLWSFAVSVGYTLPIRPLSPILSAHLGYVFDQRIERPLFASSLPPGNIIPPNVDVKGALLGVDVDAAYWLTSFLRVGPFAGADLMFLRRAKAPRAASLFGPTPEFDALPLYTETGTSLGLNVNLGLRGAFDIGLR